MPGVPEAWPCAWVPAAAGNATVGLKPPLCRGRGSAVGLEPPLCGWWAPASPWAVTVGRDGSLAMRRASAGIVVGICFPQSWRKLMAVWYRLVESLFWPSSCCIASSAVVKRPASWWVGASASSCGPCVSASWGWAWPLRGVGWSSAGVGTGCTSRGRGPPSLVLSIASRDCSSLFGMRMGSPIWQLTRPICSSCRRARVSRWVCPTMCVAHSWRFWWSMRLRRSRFW